MNQDDFWKELDGVQLTYAARLLKHYRVQARWSQIGFRSLGALLVIVSVASPLLLLIPEGEREKPLATVTFSIALLAGLNAFFQWQGLWQKACGMEVLIEQAIAAWRVQIAEAQAKGDKVAGALATRTLVDSIGSARSTETVHFFQRIKFPEGATAPGARQGGDASSEEKRAVQRR
jgi:hypothetical protein